MRGAGTLRSWQIGWLVVVASGLVLAGRVEALEAGRWEELEVLPRPCVVGLAGDETLAILGREYVWELGVGPETLLCWTREEAEEALARIEAARARLREAGKMEMAEGRRRLADEARRLLGLVAAFCAGLLAGRL